MAGSSKPAKFVAAGGGVSSPARSSGFVFCISDSSSFLGVADSRRTVAGGSSGGRSARCEPMKKGRRWPTRRSVEVLGIDLVANLRDASVTIGGRGDVQLCQVAHCWQSAWHL